MALNHNPETPLLNPDLEDPKKKGIGIVGFAGQGRLSPSEIGKAIANGGFSVTQSTENVRPQIDILKDAYTSVEVRGPLTLNRKQRRAAKNKK